jgi:hypothetical protein
VSSRALVLGLALLAWPAFAYDPGAPTSSYSQGRVVSNATHIGRNWHVPATGGGYAARANVAFDMAAPGGRVAANTMTAGFTARGVLNLGARALSGMAWPVAVGTAAWAVYDAVRVRPVPAGLAFDPGQDAIVETGTVYRVECSGQPNTGLCAWVSSMSAACANHRTMIQNGLTPPPGGSRTASVVACPSVAFAEGQFQTSAKFRIQTCEPGYGCGNQDLERGLYRQENQPFERCPAITVEGVLHVPSKSSDGKCPTGEYTQSVTPDQAAGKAETHYGLPDYAADVNYPALLDEALGRGGPHPMPQGTDIEVGNTVPSIAGPQETTTHADGTVTETATGWNFSRDDVKKNHGYWQESKTTTKKDAQGNVISTETQTSTVPKSGTQGADPCEGSSDRIMCQGLGQVEDVELENQQRDVEFEPDSGFGSGSNTCPAGPSINLSIGSISVDNSLLCTWLVAVKVFLITLAGLAGARIFVGGLSQ